MHFAEHLAEDRTKLALLNRLAEVIPQPLLGAMYIDPESQGAASFLGVVTLPDRSHLIFTAVRMFAPGSDQGTFSLYVELCGMRKPREIVVSFELMNAPPVEETTKLTQFARMLDPIRAAGT